MTDTTNNNGKDVIEQTEKDFQKFHDSVLKYEGGSNQKLLMEKTLNNSTQYLIIQRVPLGQRITV